MKKTINKVNLTGRVYQFGTNSGKDVLSCKVTGPTSKAPNTPYIGGVLNVALDEDGLNVVPVHFSYVTETTKNGSPNKTYTVLKKIIDDDACWVSQGKENAAIVEISTSIAVNDFIAQDGTPVPDARLEGGFVSTVATIPATPADYNFDVDILIKSVVEKEADEEKGTDAHVVIKGAVFDFRNALQPVEFTNHNGMNYFLGLEASNQNPVFTRVKGNIGCKTSTKVISEESAFGEAAVRTVTSRSRSWEVTWAAKETYEFGEEGVLTVEELQKAVQDREVHLADVKKQNDEWKAKSAIPAAAPKAVVAPTSNSGFDF